MKTLRKWAAAYLIENKQKPVTHTDLTFAGVDSNGTKYYTWEDLSLFPNVRRIKLHQAAMFYDAKLTPESIEKITERINEAAEALRTQDDAKKKGAIVAQIMAYTQELHRREEYAIPEHWHVQVAGLLNVTEKEDPAKWDSELHNAKCAQLQVELHSGNAFFSRIAYTASF